MKNLVRISLTALGLSFLTACTPDQPAQAPQQNYEKNRAEAMKNQELKNLQSRLTELNTSPATNLLATAQGNEVCFAYDRYKEYAGLVERAKEADVKVIGLDNDIAIAGQKAATLGYEFMLKGKPLACGMGEGHVSGRSMVENITNLIQKYGNANDVEKGVDPKVINTAYLNAAKTEAKTWLEDLKANPNNGDVKGVLAQLIEDAENWHITPAQLGVSAQMLEDLGIEN